MQRTRERRIIRWIAAAGVLLAAAAVARAQEPPKNLPLKNLVVNETPQPVGGLRFEDGHGQARSLAEFHGKVVLLNLWATWCTPCRKELPALAQLDAALDGAEFAILAVSIDRGGSEAVRKLFAALNIATLPIYSDTSGQAMRTARVNGLPTSLVIDRDGRELARVVGPAEWDGAAMIEYFRGVVARRDSRDGRSERGDMAGDTNPPNRETLRASREKHL